MILGLLQSRRLIDYGSVVRVILFEKRLPLTQTELAGSPEYIISLSNECLLPIDERGGAEVYGCFGEVKRFVVRPHDEFAVLQGRAPSAA